MLVKNVIKKEIIEIGLSALAIGVGKNDCIEILNLSSNGIEDSHGHFIAKMI
jgi:hypothetical protein